MDGLDLEVRPDAARAARISLQELTVLGAWLVMTFALAVRAFRWR